MSFNDPTSDMVASIKNGQAAKIATVSAVSNRLNKNVLQVLQDEGYINSFEEIEVRKGIKKLDINLKYFNNQAVIKHIKRVSKPGLRNYSGATTLPKTYNGLGIKIVTTSSGVVTDHEARRLNIGGEVICEVF